MGIARHNNHKVKIMMCILIWVVSVIHALGVVFAGAASDFVGANLPFLNDSHLRIYAFLTLDVISVECD